MKYRIFPALHEEASSGWVWLSQPQWERGIIRIYNEETKKRVFCEYRRIDDNFKDFYDSRPRTNKLPSSDPVIVISQWYCRRKLSIDGKEDAELDVRRAFWWEFGPIRAGLEHPDAIVRLATILALISVGLGLISLGPVYLCHVLLSKWIIFLLYLGFVLYCSWRS